VTVTLDRVRQIFRGLETDDGGAFFANVPADVRAYRDSAMGPACSKETRSREQSPRADISERGPLTG